MHPRDLRSHPLCPAPSLLQPKPPRDHRLRFGLSGIFLLSTLGLGLLISTLSRNQQQAMMTSTFFVMTPMIVLSGFVFPIENMPRLIQYFTYLLPLRFRKRLE
jgi:ABC-type multidrug transport system permease subunit